MLRRVASAALGVFLLCQPAGAQLSLTGAGDAFGVSVATYQGPGDVVSGASFWGGLRAYTAAIATGGTQKLVGVRNTSTAETCDILVASNGGLGSTTSCSGSSSGQTAATFCGANCVVTTIYDQSGNGHNLTQATGSAQPALTFSCIGALPCMTFNSASSQILAGSITSVAQPNSYSVVYNHTVATQNQEAVGTNGQNRIGSGTGSANQIEIYAGVAVDKPANDSTWHAIQVTFNGASSTLAVDSTQYTALSPSTSGTGTALGVGGNSGLFQFFTGTIAEAGLWQNTSFTGTQQTNMCHNQFTYWGTATSC